MRRLVAAPDKLRGTASAREVADAIGDAAAGAGWAAVRRPMSDGGEGFLEALGGERRTATVTGPLGRPVVAHFSLLPDGTGLVESAEAAGRALVPAPQGIDPVDAATRGVGELIVAAFRAGALRVVVGCGGVATTDGGRGCVEVLEAAGVPGGSLVAACDVEARFLDAPSRFSPQKGATPDQVALLAARLEALAAEYEARFGVDVTGPSGAGSAGGLAGGLLALGARLTKGAALVAARIGLDEALEAADLVVTAEGRVDAGTLQGKVVAEVLARRPMLPAVVVCGGFEPAAARALAGRRDGRVELVELDGALQATIGTVPALTRAVAEVLASR